MSIEKEFEKRGIELTEDSTLPVGKRTQKMFKRCMAAMRAAEAGANDEIQAANERCRSSQDKVIALQSHIRKLEQELLKFKLEERLTGIEALGTHDKTQLLEAVTPSDNNG